MQNLRLILLAFLTVGTWPVVAQEGGLRPLSSADDARGWEAVGRMDTGVSFCSATLIAPDLVLTAAHCLFDDEGRRIPDSALRFAPSLRNGRAELYRGVRRSVTHPAYRGTTTPEGSDAIARDVALLELDRPVPTATVAPIPTGQPGAARDAVTVVSYGADRESFASIEEDCLILAEDGEVQLLSCDVVSGSSGAPILRMNESGAEVIAVMSAEAEWQGSEVAVAVVLEPLLRDLLAARRAVSTGAPRLPGAIRPGDGARNGFGARFVRP